MLLLWYSAISAVLCHLQMGGYTLVIGNERRRVNQVRTSLTILCCTRRDFAHFHAFCHKNSLNFWLELQNFPHSLTHPLHSIPPSSLTHLSLSQMLHTLGLFLSEKERKTTRCVPTDKSEGKRYVPDLFLQGYIKKVSGKILIENSILFN